MTAPLTVGVPRELKSGEYRVAITPDGVHELTVNGVTVLVEQGAGAGSSLPDDEYRAAGAELVANAADVWARADLVLKVKEPQPEEFACLRPGLVLFTYLHLAAYPEVADALLEHEVVGDRVRDGAARVGRTPAAGADERGGRSDGAASGLALPRARTADGASCSVAHPAFGPRASSSSAPATSGGTRRGSRKAWKPRSCSSTATSTGCAGSIRSTKAGS